MEYHLIVELQVGDQEGVKQFGIINSRCIRNIQTVNPETCYTGKSIVIDIDGELVAANVCMISDDLTFIREQFRYIQNQSAGEPERRETAMRPPQPPHRPQMNDEGTSRQHSPDSAMPDPPPNPPRVPPMTFDQQTQTDRRLFDGMVPVSQEQMNQFLEHFYRLQSQMNAFNGTLNEIHQYQVALANSLNDVVVHQQEHARQLRELAPGYNNMPPENSVYLQLTPDGSSPNEELIIDEADIPIEDTKPIVRTFKTVKATSWKSSDSDENDENVTPNVKKVRYAPIPNKVGECSRSQPQQMVYQPEEDIVIGPNGTTIPALIVKNLNWACYSVATRRILVAVFSREILATHSLSGKPSPAFLDRNAKKQLDPRKIQDIIHFVTKNANVPESNVRSIITAKCADENKMKQSIGHQRKSSSDSNGRKQNAPKPIKKRMLPQ